MTDELFLSQHDSRPMYLQIMDQIKQKIFTGDWPAGQALPSIRELSASTKVSVITVKRAYTELEEQGVIVTQPGRGSFVASTKSDAESLSQELKQQMETLIKNARELGINDEDLLISLKKMMLGN